MSSLPQYQRGKPLPPVRALAINSYGYAPIFVGAFVDPELDVDIKYGEPLAYEGQYVKPLRATFDGTDWTLNGVFAGFAGNPNGQGENNWDMVEMYVIGTLNASAIDLSDVSETVGNTFTLADLLATATNLKAGLIDPRVMGGRPIAGTADSEVVRVLKVDYIDTSAVAIK